jgi:hypothetical protein
MALNEEFNKKLLEKENPFQYPEPPRRPSFVIGGEAYVRAFEDLYDNRSKQDGTISTFIVGMPGSGKTHLLRHLGYLFYDHEKGQFKGLYALSRLSDQEIDEKEIWKQLLLAPESIDRLASLIPKDRILSAQIRQDIKANLIKLLDQTLDVDSLNIEAVRKLAEEISNLLPEGAIICIALDNIEEYLSARENDYLVRAKATPEESQTKERATADAVKLLVEKIRNMTSDLKSAVILLALTQPAWAEVQKTEAARTKARRFKFAEEEQRLEELTLLQSFQLVHEYLDRWAKKNSVNLPQDDECTCKSTPEPLSIYPFTPLSIELAYRVTDRWAGDITCFCSECIDRMRTSKQVRVVKDELVIDNLLKITKEYPWLPWVDRAKTLLEEWKPKILEKRLTAILAEIQKRTQQKYYLGVDTQTVIRSIERYAQVLGVKISPVDEAVENAFNPSAEPIEPSELLKIWSLGETKIAVQYVVGDKHKHIPELRVYGGRTALKDYVSLVSLVEAGKASHGLTLLIWAVEDFGLASKVIPKGFGNTIQGMSLDDHLFQIIGVAETAEDQEDLVIFMDNVLGVHLKARLEMLTKEERPAYKPVKYTTEQY